MKSKDWERVQAIYHEAIEKPTADVPKFLDRACGDDLALREEVNELLGAREERGEFFAEPGQAPSWNVLASLESVEGELVDVSLGDPLDLSSGERVGAYKLLQAIGEGDSARCGWRSRSTRCDARSRSRSSSSAWTRRKSSLASRPSVRPWR